MSSSQLVRNQYISLIIHHENRNVLTRSLSRNSLSFIIPVCLYSLDIRCYILITQLLMVLGFSLFSLSISMNKTKKNSASTSYSLSIIFLFSYHWKTTTTPMRTKTKSISLYSAIYAHTWQKENHEIRYVTKIDSWIMSSIFLQND